MLDFYIDTFLHHPSIRGCKVQKYNCGEFQVGSRGFESS